MKKLLCIFTALALLFALALFAVPVAAEDAGSWQEVYFKELVDTRNGGQAIHTNDDCWFCQTLSDDYFERMRKPRIFYFDLVDVNEDGTPELVVYQYEPSEGIYNVTTRSYVDDNFWSFRAENEGVEWTPSHQHDEILNGISDDEALWQTLLEAGADFPSLSLPMDTPMPTLEPHDYSESHFDIDELLLRKKKNAFLSSLYEITRGLSIGITFSFAYSYIQLRKKKPKD